MSQGFLGWVGILRKSNIIMRYLGLIVRVSGKEGESNGKENGNWNETTGI